MTFTVLVKDMPMMRKQLMTKKKLGGSTFMVMCLGTRSISHFLQQPWVLAHSCLPCEYACL